MKKPVLNCGMEFLRWQKKLKLPVYHETVMDMNKLAYERYGLKAYHWGYNEKENIKFWFTKWEP